MAKKHKSYKFRIYPNKEQKMLIHKTFGCSRFIYNYFLSLWNESYETTGKGLSYNKCSLMLTEMKKEEEFSFLKEVDSTALQSSLQHLDDGFKRFFKKQNRKPRFKSRKNNVQSYVTKKVRENIKILENKIRLPKLGYIRFKKSREVNGKILNAMISKTKTDKYFISIACEIELFNLPKTDNNIGIDLGLTHFAILSDGNKIENPKYLEKSIKKIQKLSKQLSRKREIAKKSNIPIENAKNYQKQKKQLAKLHEKVRNQRLDFLHKLSTKIILENDIICIEDLNIKGLLKNHRLAKSISSVGWSKFITMLEYKADWYGKEVIKINRFYPSSQLCSCCGENTGKKPLNVREFRCPYCGCEHDRDVNASRNILNEGLRLHSLNK